MNAVTWILLTAALAGHLNGLDNETGRCQTLPNTPRKVAEGVRQCSEEVKTNMIQEAFNIIRYQWDQRQQQSQQQPVNQILQHVYRPILKNQNVLQAQAIKSQVYPSLIRHQPLPVPVNYSDFLASNSYQSPIAKPLEHIVRLYSSNSQPPQAMQLPAYANLNIPNHSQQLPKSQYTPIHQQFSNLLPLSNAPDDLKYYQYVPFDPNTQRRRRDDNLGMTLQDKRIAGCLMHCIYSKHHAVDHMGWPTLDGLVSFYSEGVQEHGYFMATMRASNTCLKGLSNKYNINRQLAPAQGQSCDLSFDVFDCISDKITEYCGN